MPPNNTANLKKVSSVKKQKRHAPAKANPKTEDQKRELELQAADAREADFIVRWLSDVIIIRPEVKDGE